MKVKTIILILMVVVTLRSGKVIEYPEYTNCFSSSPGVYEIGTTYFGLPLVRASYPVDLVESCEVK